MIFPKKIIGTIGSSDIFPKPGGDISVSPDGKWLVNGYNNKSGSNFYSIMNLKTGAWVKTPSFETGDYKKGFKNRSLHPDGIEQQSNLGFRIG